MAPDRRHRGGDETSHGRGARAMKLAKVLILSLIGAAISASAAAQAPMQISPSVARPPANIPSKPAQKPKAAKRPALKKSIEPALALPARQIPAPSAPTAFAPDHPPIAPFAAPDKPAAPSNTKTTALQPATMAEQGDVAYGAYQRGYYLEAFKEATRRAGEGDPV